jgi:hypothetical protein
METESDRHFADELLETYSMGHLPEEQVPPLEEHVLMCSGCQDRLTSIDQYIQVARAAALELEHKKAAPKSSFVQLLLGHFWPIPKPVWALGLVTASVAVLLTVVTPSQLPPGRPTELTLTASRGRESLQTHASSQGTLVLKIDASTIPAAPAYRLEIVNANGGEIWKTDVTSPSDHQISAQVPKLSRGNYWIRVYSMTDLASPLQEYGLAID